VDTSSLSADRDATLRRAHGVAFGRISDALARGDDDAVSAAVEDLVDACQAYVGAR
jgi:hypothetical protein